MRYTGPKHKLARREGVNVIEKESRSLDRRINIPPGVHGRKGRKKLSEYGLQLREKQKLKRIYGLSENQFRNCVSASQREKGNTTEVLVQLLETRLDNIVYRLGFTNSRPQARQFVSHRHVLVDGKKVNIPSYNVGVGETIMLSPKLLQKDSQAKISGNARIPSFLKRKNGEGELVRLPMIEEVSNPVDYQLVVEFYSR